MPKISVVMPVYNSQKYLKEAIESILLQSAVHIELIIVSEFGSTDCSDEIVHEYMQKDNRIIIIKNNQRLGISASLNKAIDSANGKYIARMDADDIAYPDRLKVQVEFMERNKNIDVCGSDVKYINEDGKTRHCLHDYYPLTDEKIKAGFMFYCYLWHPTVFIRKESLDRYKLRYNEAFYASEDFELWTRASQHLKFANIPQALLKYRFHSENATNIRKQEGINNYIRIMDRSFKNLGITFTKHQLELLCPMTYKHDEANKKERMNELLECADAIRNANKERNIYDKASLEYILKVRTGWAKHILRHRIVTLLRKAAIGQGKVSKVIDLIANHLEEHGLISLIKRIFTFAIYK